METIIYNFLDKLLTIIYYYLGEMLRDLFISLLMLSIYLICYLLSFARIKGDFKFIWKAIKLCSSSGKYCLPYLLIFLVLNLLCFCYFPRIVVFLWAEVLIICICLIAPAVNEALKKKELEHEEALKKKDL
ncbi:hypothetical protein G293_04960 [Candidatus Liberibacter africanus PTSAPSY]|uniref:Transmembrane protein n=1 Tax=Candidatus Liberibacter africanus PTSAPSY TaxID=1277257 RepID=A0A0G3I9X3_LIBAF|nr:hypothetical protein G293_04960 [Candidatus Liberibacter africanus PTSAPSY]